MVDSANNSVTIVIPVFNEEAGLTRTLPDIVKSAGENRCEILIVDDGSTDSGMEVVEGYSQVRIVAHPCNMGYGAAVKTGVLYSQTPWILLMDCDGQHNPRDISLFCSRKEGGDLVVGSRENLSEPLIKATGRKLFSCLIRFISGSSGGDFNSGFRIFKRDRFLKFCNLFPDGFSLTTTMMVCFLSSGYSVKFVPIRISKRVGGPSKVSIFKDGISTIRLLFRLLMFFSPHRLMIAFSSLFVFFSLLSRRVWFHFFLMGFSILLLFLGYLMDRASKKELNTMGVRR